MEMEPIIYSSCWFYSHFAFSSQLLNIQTEHSVLASIVKSYFQYIYPVYPKIRPNLKISPSMIFQDAHNITPTPKISPS